MTAPPPPVHSSDRVLGFDEVVAAGVSAAPLLQPVPVWAAPKRGGQAGVPHLYQSCPAGPAGDRPLQRIRPVRIFRPDVTLCPQCVTRAASDPTNLVNLRPLAYVGAVRQWTSWRRKLERLDSTRPAQGFSLADVAFIRGVRFEAVIGDPVFDGALDSLIADCDTGAARLLADGVPDDAARRAGRLAALVALEPLPSRRWSRPVTPRGGGDNLGALAHGFASMWSAVAAGARPYAAAAGAFDAVCEYLGVDDVQMDPEIVEGMESLRAATLNWAEVALDHADALLEGPWAAVAVQTLGFGRQGSLLDAALAAFETLPAVGGALALVIVPVGVSEVVSAATGLSVAVLAENPVQSQQVAETAAALWMVDETRLGRCAELAAAALGVTLSARTTPSTAAGEPTG